MSNNTLKSGLYIVSTPIGNLMDITYRAVETLKGSNYILAEDTRVTSRLLSKYNIATKLLTYTDHSKTDVMQKILKYLQDGAVVSIVSDSGTPLISDPGYKLVKFLESYNCYIEVIPGVSSVIAAITISGLPLDKFTFMGFLPKSVEGKNNLFKKLIKYKNTLVFFESPQRLITTIECIIKVFGDVDIVVARELTKVHQTIHKGTAQELLEYFEINSARGEIVLLIDNTEVTKQHLPELRNEIANYLKKNLYTSQIVDNIISLYPNLKKREVYRNTQAIKRDIENGVN